MDRMAGLPKFPNFEAILDPEAFRSLPADWVIGLTDVVNSTEAIGMGRYKAVNIAGAAAISAMTNALGTQSIPFAFAGDGCAFALPRGDAALAREVLAATAAWVRDDLDLSLRAALVPVEAIRQAGLDVRVALFAPSEHVAYAMFDGGGVAFAEAEMKEGRFRIEPAGAGVRPDLTGLSCRWLPMKSRRGEMVSIIVRPSTGATAQFRESVGALLSLLRDGEHPVPQDGPSAGVVLPGIRLEALASRGAGRFWPRLVRTFAHNLMGWFLFATGWRVGTFDPGDYRRMISQNADARKFDDGLMLTLDCDVALRARIRTFLEDAAARGLVRFGMVTQDAALMTCIVPSYQDRGHYHFIDGAGGGYAAAAKAMEGQV